MIRRALMAVVIASPCVLASSALAQGADELWEITAKMTMDGMSMPATLARVCQKKSDNIPPAEKDCKISDVRTSGNRTTWRVECTGTDPMSGVGEITKGNGTYRGTVKMKAKAADDDSTAVMEYSGKLVGNCRAN